MIHHKEKLDQTDIVKKDDGLYWLECPICGKDYGCSEDYDMMPVFAVCHGTPTHEDWKAYKKEKGLTNYDIANIIGITPDSVKNQTQSNKDLPKWAISMLYEWKN
ncbi:hypothetical protein [Chryseobacterium gallinarum]|uniref:XRE family transcriptional regulator n=1 Tax=Chryseobacterium gallinarum TaxID=1324352 RepID=A0ABX6KUM1_CHRGL|nr:hypothetical protein [Chryseobacterium gallinarum]QIY92225.1 hypothetical protein FOB44_16835 [Chryseobacterium gallinarum]